VQAISAGSFTDPHRELLLRSLLILVSRLLLATVHLHRDVGRFRETCFTPVEMNNAELNVPVKLNTPNPTKNDLCYILKLRIRRMITWPSSRIFF
jgi:hypothetical protein